jgi:hypothetical protein
MVGIEPRQRAGLFGIEHGNCARPGTGPMLVPNRGRVVEGEFPNLG